MNDSPLSNQAKNSIKSVFLILFLDLMGFSIIFPLFPELIKFYLENDANSILLNWIIQLSTSFSGESSMFTNIVFFGGFLGALYSLLQFIASPFWGNLSDRWGRKRVLQITLVGTFLSYLVWIFSASFNMLILSRVIGGFMSGNISVATSCVSDVTSEKNRSRGMAFVGIAFALGFILGPALGGAFATVQLTGSSYLHPFSAVALVASVLSLINIILFMIYFKETKKTKVSVDPKLMNPLEILKNQNDNKLNLVNYSYFLFIILFSAMEFTLTFLAFERLSYTSMDNAILFVFIGLILVLVQGGFIRKYAGRIGEKKVAMTGLFLLIPGHIILAYFTQQWPLFLGLFFLAVASSFIIPTLTALNSLFAPAEAKGKHMGKFRSLGALGRIIGPLLGCFLYWKYGSENLYLAITGLCVFPIILIYKLPQPSKNN